MSDPIIISPTTKTVEIQVPTVVTLSAEQLDSIRASLASLGITFAPGDSHVQSIQIEIAPDGTAKATVVFAK